MRAASVPLLCLNLCGAQPVMAQEYAQQETVQHASSGNVANAAATATLAAVAGRTAKLLGLMVTGSGATAAATVTCTITGLNGGVLAFTYGVPAGAGVPATPFTLPILAPIPASGQNVAIVASCPAMGAGSTRLTISIIGYYR